VINKPLNHPPVKVYDLDSDNGGYMALFKTCVTQKSAVFQTVDPSKYWDDTKGNNASGKVIYAKYPSKV
jgi:hypothetical protein